MDLLFSAAIIAAVRHDNPARERIIDGFKIASAPVLSQMLRAEQKSFGCFAAPISTIDVAIHVEKPS